MELGWLLPKGDFELGMLVGCGATIYLYFILFVVTPLISRRDIYNLAHWKLNVRTPVQPMWMNLGFWRTVKGDPIRHLDQACATLLREVLLTSGLIGQSLASDREGRSRRSLAILDVGFGCGDQTWELARVLETPTWSDFRYVGLTLNRTQLEIARQRQNREIAAAKRRGADLWPESFRLFAADAAKPDSWSKPVTTMVQGIAQGDFTDKWLLALDCMYHFSPSRQPLLRYAAQTLGANFMAFDLTLNDRTTMIARLAARITGRLLSCPYYTFLTQAQYIDNLVACGYDRETIMVRDVTYDVFPGLVSYLERQQRDLQPYGISMGAFNWVRRVFKWFADSGTIRAIIVVAEVKKTAA